MPTPITFRRALGAALLAAGLAACAPAQGAIPGQPTSIPAPPTSIPAPPTSIPAPPTVAPPTPTQPAAPAIPLATAQATVQSFLEAYFAGGDAFVYLGGPVGAEVAAGRPLDQFMGSQPGYSGFVVHEPQATTEGAAVWADVTYGDTVVEQRFDLAPSLGEWVIVGINVAGTRPSGPPAAGGAPWQSAISGDLNGDGVTDQLSYRPITIQLPPAGFSDPSIVAVMLASELTISAEAAPNGRELLYLSPSAMTAEGHFLAGFEGEQPAGFLVVAYGGERHTFRVTPLRADGQPLDNRSYEVFWSDAEGGYRAR